MAEWLVIPDGPNAGEPLVLTAEQAQFVLDFYAIDPHTGERMIRRAILSRPKGWGKSPLMAGLCLAEALAPVKPVGWDADGEPVLATWESQGFKPKVQILGVSEDQTANTWDPLLDMVRNGPLVDMPGVQAMDTFVTVPRGRIEAVTSSATSREGFRPVFAVFDQTESWTASNGGKKVAAAVQRNLSKMNGSSIETPNSYRPGFGSVAEDSFKAWQQQQEGKLKNDTGILLDHREAPADTDITDRESMLEGLRIAYGCSANAPCVLAERHDHPEHEPGWVEIPRILSDFWDPATDPSDGRMYFLNQVTSASDAWITSPEWLSCRWDSEARVIDPKEPIVLGFDGSRSKARGKADATALVGCTVRDGHVFLIRGWEQPDNVEEWEVPTIEVEAEIHDTFKKFNVIGMYADPAKWESYIANWEAKYGSRLKVKSSQKHPIEWWMTGGRSGMVAKALSLFHTAVTEEEMTHDGSAMLTRHVLNARRKIRGDLVHIGKEFPDSPNKIDAAVAATLAWQARLDAVALGYGQIKKLQAPRRLR
ncbi:terminase family protein [Rhodococcus triatomae]